MKRVLFLILFGAHMLFSSSLNPALIEIEAKLFPKIILLDEQIDQKLVDGQLLVNIIVQKKYIAQARLFKKLIDNKVVYDKQIRAKITITQPMQKASAYILFTDAQEAKRIYTMLFKKNRIVLSALPEAIEGAIASVAINSKVEPLINPKTLQSSSIKLNPIIFKVAKFYEVH